MYYDVSGGEVVFVWDCEEVRKFKYFEGGGI